MCWLVVLAVYRQHRNQLMVVSMEVEWVTKVVAVVVVLPGLALSLLNLMFHLSLLVVEEEQVGLALLLLRQWVVSVGYPGD
jgi:hypothetical protein